MSALFAAELLKLRKRRGLVAATLALTVLPMIVAYIVLPILHATNPGHYGPAGGGQNFSDSINFLGALVIFAGTVVGATVGTGDLGAGVFRELVVTGRSRLALYAARVPAGLAFLLPAIAVAFAISAAAAALLAGGLDQASAGLLAGSAAWLALVGTTSFALALGVSSLIGSRGTSMAVLLGWQVVAMPMLLQTHALGAPRERLLGAAIEHFEPARVLGHPDQAPMGTAAALLVVVIWMLAPIALGAWRTVTRDA
jgi:hypothetical protein